MKSLISLFVIASLLAGCGVTPTATNEKLYRESIGAATVGQKPGALEHARRHIIR